MTKPRLKSLLFSGVIGVVLGCVLGSFATQLAEIINIAIAVQMILEAAKRN